MIRIRTPAMQLARSAAARNAPATALVPTRPTSSYVENQESKGRPLSPHVTIYKFPPVAMSSIAVRATGVGLAGGMAVMGAAGLVGADVSALVAGFRDAAPILVPPAKFAVSFSFIYHYLGAVRHAVWDKNPDMLTNESVQSLSYAMFGGSAVASAILAFV